MTCHPACPAGDNIDLFCYMKAQPKWTEHLSAARTSRLASGAQHDLIYTPPNKHVAPESSVEKQGSPRENQVLLLAVSQIIRVCFFNVLAVQNTRHF